MARPKENCPACGEKEKLSGHYLCPACWRELPRETQRRLYLHDADARNRLFQLYSALRRGVALEKIEVAA